MVRELPCCYDNSQYEYYLLRHDAVKICTRVLEVLAASAFRADLTRFIKRMCNMLPLRLTRTVANVPKELTPANEGTVVDAKLNKAHRLVISSLWTPRINSRLRQDRLV